MEIYSREVVVEGLNYGRFSSKLIKLVGTGVVCFGKGFMNERTRTSCLCNY